jgi:hypothetical protein
MGPKGEPDTKTKWSTDRRAEDKLNSDFLLQTYCKLSGMFRCLFHDAVCIADYTNSNGRKTGKNELEIGWRLS